MRKERLFLYLILIFSLGAILPKLLNPNLGFIYALEEIAFSVALLISFFIFHKKIAVSVERIDNQFTWTENFQKRLIEVLKLYLFYVVLTGGIIALCLFLYLKNMGLPDWYDEILMEKRANGNFHKGPERGAYPGVIPLAFGFSSMLFGILFIMEEVFLFNERKTKERINLQKLQKEQALLKANALKKQLNPHFMFNTLNVLSGLIHEDIAKSDKFIKELSEIYRYVLEQSEETLSTLKKEVKFIESYFYLLKIRFEEKLQYDIKIPVENLNLQIPSLTLELLVENAIKHNIISEKSPLTIEIYLHQHNLIVKNNLQLREDEVQSIGKGINNLQERLKLLGAQGAHFGSNGKHYISSVPLLNP